MKLTNLLEAKHTLYKQELLLLQQELSPFDAVIAKSKWVDPASENSELVLTLNYECKSFKAYVELQIRDGEHQPKPVLHINATNLKELLSNNWTVFVLTSNRVFTDTAALIKTTLMKAFIFHLLQSHSKDMASDISLAAVATEKNDELEDAIADKKLFPVIVPHNHYAEALRRHAALGNEVVFKYEALNAIYILMKAPRAFN